MKCASVFKHISMKCTRSNHLKCSEIKVTRQPTTYTIQINLIHPKRRNNQSRMKPVNQTQLNNVKTE